VVGVRGYRCRDFIIMINSKCAFREFIIMINSDVFKNLFIYKFKGGANAVKISSVLILKLKMK
jgi:hypothetical protein